MPRVSCVTGISNYFGFFLFFHFLKTKTAQVKLSVVAKMNQRRLIKGALSQYFELVCQCTKLP